MRAPLRVVLLLLLCVSTNARASSSDDDRARLVRAFQNALATHERGDASDALREYEAILADASARPHLSAKAEAILRTNAGGIYYQRGNVDESRAHFKRATELDPSHAEARVNLANLLSEDVGSHEDALTHAREAVRLRPDHAKSHHLLGNVLQHLGQDIEAALRFKTAETLAAGDAAANAPAGIFQIRATEVGETKPWISPDGRELTVRTISVTPPVFRVEGFVTEREREAVIRKAAPEMRESRTVADGGKAGPTRRRKSETAWLVTHGDDALEALSTRATALLNLSADVAAAEERVQVLRYEKGGYFDVHHESTAFLRRFATVLYYLSGPGEGNGGHTAFPLGPHGEGTGEGTVVATAGNVTAACEGGVRAAPVPGDAIFFYNFGVDGRVDANAMHAACEVTGGTKWAANHWFNLAERRRRSPPPPPRDELR